MGKLLVDVDREALERVRVKLGARSGAEAIRWLINEKDAKPGSGFDRVEWERLMAAQTLRAQDLVAQALADAAASASVAEAGAKGAARAKREYAAWVAEVTPLDTSRAKVTNPGKPKVPYGSRLKKR